MNAFARVMCLAALAGCGGGAAASGPTANVAVPPPADSSGSASVVTGAATATASSAQPNMRTASAEIRRYWVSGDGDGGAVYADFTGLAHTDILRALVPAVLDQAKGSITAEQTQCVQSAVGAVREVAFGASKSDGLLLIHFDDQAFSPTTCLPAFGLTKTQVDGASDAYTSHGGDPVIAHAPGILLVGSKQIVTGALAQAPGATSFPARLALAPDEYVTWFAHADETRAHGTLLASSERFRLSVHADIPERFAQQAEKQLHSMQGSAMIPGLDGNDAQVVASLLKSVELKRSGGHIDAAFDLHEPPADQLRDLGSLTALAVHGVRKYLADAKAAEARNTVGQIGKDYTMWWEKDDGKPRAKKKLFSLPAVPRTIPRGVKYQSSPADWKAWDRLKFEMDAPQYYQYEVKAAPDGESAVIIARGDLNGDGKASQFRFKLHIDRANGSAMMFDPDIEETDPEE